MISQRIRALAAAGVVLVAACTGGGGGEPQPPHPSPTPSTVPSPTASPSPTPSTWPRPCPDVYAPDRLPTFELTISSGDWNTLVSEFHSGLENWYPATFRYEDEVYEDVMVRNRGNNSRCGEKLQFAISFNKIDDDGRFHGLRRINLDHGGCKPLNERLALAFARDLGVNAACANNARLVVNGSYYGLFTNIEAVNKDFLKRNFQEHDGNLWKSGDELKTNEEEPYLETKLGDFWAADTLEEVEALTDVEQAIDEWAAEAALPAYDNFWLHGWNYYLYEHPTRGFLFLPHDWDQAWPYSSSRDFDPLHPVRQQPATIVLENPAWREAYLEALEEAWQAYDADLFQDRVDTWWAQIVIAASEDPFLTIEADSDPPNSLTEHFLWRRSWLRQWLDCQDGGSPCPPPDGAAP